MLLLNIGYIPVLANIMTTIDKGLVISVLSTSIRLQPKKIQMTTFIKAIFDSHILMANNTYIF